MSYTGNPLNYEIVESSRFDYVFQGNPPINVNPPRPNAVALNASTGKLFHCTDMTPDWNKWNGVLGRFVFDEYLGFDPLNTPLDHYDIITDDYEDDSILCIAAQYTNRATHKLGRSSGKRYFETWCNFIADSSYQRVGLGISGERLDQSGNGINDFVMSGSGCSFINNNVGVGVTGGLVWQSNATFYIGVAADLDNHKIWFVTDNNWGGIGGSGNPETGEYPCSILPNVELSIIVSTWGNDTIMKINPYGDFVNNIPEGYIPWGY